MPSVRVPLSLNLLQRSFKCLGMDAKGNQRGRQGQNDTMFSHCISSQVANNGHAAPKLELADSTSLSGLEPWVGKFLRRISKQGWCRSGKPIVAMGLPQWVRRSAWRQPITSLYGHAQARPRVAMHSCCALAVGSALFWHGRLSAEEMGAGWSSHVSYGNQRCGFVRPELAVSSSAAQNLLEHIRGEWSGCAGKR